MSRLAINNLKSKLKNMYDTNIKINIGFYDDNDNIVEEKNIPSSIKLRERNYTVTCSKSCKSIIEELYKQNNNF